MKTDRLTKWPYWRKVNARLFIGGLAAYVAGFAFLCTCRDSRYVFIELTLIAFGSSTGLLFGVINHKDCNERDI